MDQGRGPGIALVYDDDAYEERHPIPNQPPGTVPDGLMGRQVAGRSFLNAYLSCGTWSELSAVVSDHTSAGSLVRLWRDHPATRSGSRTLRIIERASFHRTFFPQPPATVLHAPQPPGPEFAWARQCGSPDAFAISGVTHTLCSPEALELLRSLVTAPFEPYDALVCTSRAVAAWFARSRGRTPIICGAGSAGSRRTRRLTPFRYGWRRFRWAWTSTGSVPPSPEEQDRGAAIARGRRRRGGGPVRRPALAPRQGAPVSDVPRRLRSGPRDRAAAST